MTDLEHTQLKEKIIKKQLYHEYWRSKWRREFGKDFYPISGGVGHPGGNDLRQLAFRGRADDGVESLQESDGGATWLAALNVNFSIAVGTQFRLRILYRRNSLQSQEVSWHYSKNGATFTAVTKSGSNVNIADTTFFAEHDDATDFTGRLGTGTWADDTNFHLLEDTNQTGGASFSSGEQMESEITLKWIEDDVNELDTFRFRLRNQINGVFSDGYARTPIITVLKPEAIKAVIIKGRSVIIRGKSIKIG